MKKGVVLALVAVVALSMAGLFTSPTRTPAPEPPRTGITVQSPLQDEKVVFPLTIRGYVNGDGWFGFEGQVGTVRVLDSDGKIVSPAVPLTATTEWTQLPTYFEVQVGDAKTVSVLTTSTGTLLFTSESPRGAEFQKEFRLPVRFR
jgi:hypothetical protein